MTILSTLPLQRSAGLLLGIGASLLLFSSVGMFKIPWPLVFMTLVSALLWWTRPAFAARMFPGLLILTALSGSNNFGVAVIPCAALIVTMLLNHPRAVSQAVQAREHRLLLIPTGEGNAIVILCRMCYVANIINEQD
ncbi:hypothetical protein [Deinococcus sp. QL22]|uniref:hypothetical protein n=1 Tax=Deinococcus sp. QL22 TaxID=2939437 RepID=UPI002017B659|nr:hypothetical protein [Deinococcus sp. QL22]UQN08829.1 hypothetical protein M1R55_19740 [Deinococcus sp. QL22]